MKKTHAIVVNYLGLLALLLGVFTTFTGINGAIQQSKSAQESAQYQYDETVKQIDLVRDYKEGIGIEDLDPEVLAKYLEISDSTLVEIEGQINTEFDNQKSQIKLAMWDDIASESGKQIALIILGIALLFVSKGLSSIVEKINVEKE